uniref:Uncharacterized protein n=1 Tax=Amphimedon queenslandica TaxID=400682 RepID=A0A1X7SZ69_AMPQE
HLCNISTCQAGKTILSLTLSPRITRDRALNTLCLSIGGYRILNYRRSGYIRGCNYSRS